MTLTTAETTNERESCFMERTPAVGTESGLHGGNPRQPHRHSRSDSERCMDAANRGSSPEICCSISCKTRRSRSLNMTTSRLPGRGCSSTPVAPAPPACTARTGDRSPKRLGRAGSPPARRGGPPRPGGKGTARHAAGRPARRWRTGSGPAG
jgi:hypothetical protein